MPATTRPLHRLTPAQLEQYHRLGYVKGFPVFSQDEVRHLQAEYEKLVALLPSGTGINFVN